MPADDEAYCQESSFSLYGYRLSVPCSALRLGRTILHDVGGAASLLVANPIHSQRPGTVPVRLGGSRHEHDQLTHVRLREIVVLKRQTTNKRGRKELQGEASTGGVMRESRHAQSCGRLLGCEREARYAYFIGTLASFKRGKGAVYQKGNAGPADARRLRLTHIPAGIIPETPLALPSTGKRQQGQEQQHQQQATRP